MCVYTSGKAYTLACVVNVTCDAYLVLLPQMCQLHSTITETGNSVISSRVVQQFTGGHKCKLLSRSSLFVKPNNRHTGTLLAAYGDEATHSVSITPNHYKNIFNFILGTVMGH